MCKLWLSCSKHGTLPDAERPQRCITRSNQVCCPTQPLVHLLTVALALCNRSAYRKLSKKFHPDRNKEKSAEERFLKISQAYDVLSDEEMRQVYDQHVCLFLILHLPINAHVSL